MEELKYFINIHERDWSIILSTIYVKDKVYNILEIGKDANLNEFAHIRVDKDNNICFVYDVFSVSNIKVEDKRFNTLVNLKHKNKSFIGTLNYALEYIQKELLDE